MGESRLYLAPCDNPQLSRYFDHTVLEGLDGDIHDHHVATENTDDVLHFWGIPKQKGERYSHMSSGDFLLFYTGDGSYEYAAKIIDMEQNQGLLDALESKFHQDDINTKALDRWEYFIYLQPPFSVSIASDRLHDFAGHSRNQPFNFSQLNIQGKEAIRNKFETIENYLDTKKTEASEDLSNRLDTGTKKQFQTTEEVVDEISTQVSTSASIISDDVSKLDKRDIPLTTIYEVVLEKHASDSEASILSIDATGIVRAARLYEAGYTTIEAIADTTVSNLLEVEELSKSAAEVISEHAQELLSGESVAAEIAAETDDIQSEIETTFRSVGATGVPRSEARPIVKELHTRPSLLDIHGLQRRTAYYLIDHGYDTPEKIANADSEALLEVPQIGEGNVDSIQENAAEFDAKNTIDHTSRSPRLSKLDDEQKQEAARILGITYIDSLTEKQWDGILSRFFSKVIDSPIDIQIDSDE